MNKYGKEILVVVCDVPNLFGATDLGFRRSGYRVNLAFSIQDAMDRLRNASFDLVVTDLTTLSEEGFLGCLERIQKLQPGIMMMVLTGKGEPALVLDSMGAIPDYILVKSGSMDLPLWFPCWLEKQRSVN